MKLVTKIAKLSKEAKEWFECQVEAQELLRRYEPTSKKADRPTP